MNELAVTKPSGIAGIATEIQAQETVLIFKLIPEGGSRPTARQEIALILETSAVEFVIAQERTINSEVEAIAIDHGIAIVAASIKFQPA